MRRPPVQNMDNKDVSDFWKKKELPRKSFDDLIQGRDALKKLTQLIRDQNCKPQDVEEAAAAGANFNMVVDSFPQESLLTLAINKRCSAAVISAILTGTHDLQGMMKICHPFPAAVSLGSPEVLAAFFSVARRYIDINDTTGNGDRALDIAVKKQFESGVKVLLDEGADVSKLPEKQCLVAQAVGLPNVSIARMLLVALRKKETLDSKFLSAILKEAMWAYAGPHVDMIKMLVAEGVELKGGKRSRHIHRAVENKKPEVVALFLEAGVDPNTVDSNFQSTPLHALSRVLNEDIAIEIARKLIEAGANLEAKDADGRTPLEAITTWMPKFTKLIELLQQKAAPSPVVATTSVALQGKVQENIIEK